MSMFVKPQYEVLWPKSDGIHITSQGIKEALAHEGPSLLQVGLRSSGSWFGSLATGCGRTVSQSL